MAAPITMFSRCSVQRINCISTRWPALRLIHCTASRSSADESAFKAAQDRVLQLKEAPGNEIKLKLYAFFKQASLGENKTKKPGAFDIVGKYKWSAWSELGDMSQGDARQGYVDLVNELAAAEGSTETPSETNTSEGKYNNIVVTSNKGIQTVRFNRPAKKNAFTRESYAEIIEAFTEANENDEVKAVVLTGTGDFYSSGNDLGNFMNVSMEEIPKMAKDGRYLLLKFVSAFIELKKPLVAVCNGSAVGVAVTTLGLCDVVYAKESATFQTPMVALGQSPEGTSSFMFPKVMGQSRANEMLLFGKKITAQQACNWGLVTEIFPDAIFDKEIESKLEDIAALPRQSLQYSKNLIRGVDKETLHKTNERECELLEERWQSNECAEAVMAFFQKHAEAKSKL